MRQKYYYLFINLIYISSIKGVHNFVNSTEQGVCLTPTCVLEASRIIQSLDESQSPCHDFYQFTCGQWIESTKLPDHKSSINSFTELQDVVNLRIKDVLDNIDPENETLDFKIKIKEYYDSCMNTSFIDHLDTKPLTDLLSKLMANNWPLSEVNSTILNWTELYLKLRTMGVTNTMLFSLSVGTDIRNNSKRLDQPSFGLSKHTLLNPEKDVLFDAYRKLIIRSVEKLTGKSINFNQSMIDSIIQFEISLAKILVSKEQRRNLTLIIYETNDNSNDDISSDDIIWWEEPEYFRSIYNKKTIRHLKKVSPKIDWLRIIRTVISDDIKESDPIILNDISFVRKLDNLLFKTNNQIIVNYMIWRVIHSKQLSLSSDWLRIRHEYEFLMHGTKKAKPRWHHCIKTIENGFQLLISHLYVKHYFDPQIKQKATKLIENVRSEFKTTLNQTDWIDERTLTIALDKLNKMTIMVGYPEQIFNETSISEYYKQISFNSSNFFGNILKVNEWKQNSSFNSLKVINDIHDWRRVGSLTRANAFYNIVKNTVLIPAAILQDVFYNKDRPNYLNYGAIAKTAAHEIIHAFDSHGRHFDAEGNLNYWWNGDTDQKYREREKCFVSQYNDYFIDTLGLNVNGIHTKAENIADNGGIKLAFKAYRNHIYTYGDQGQLPALNYTSDQLFWIIYGVHYCSKQNNESLRNLIMNDSHTPKKYRINGALSNSEEFSKSFNCAVGSPMNPINKCSIW